MRKLFIALPLLIATQFLTPAQPTPQRTQISATAWTAHQTAGRETVVPDAAISGTAGQINSDDVVGRPVLLVGCEKRAAGLTPVIRMTVPTRFGIDLSSLPTAPPVGFVPMTQRIGLTMDGLWGERAAYIAGSGKTFTLVQYDADPREVGRLAATDAPGKRLDFTPGALEFRFVMPAENGALSRVLAACQIQPWSPQSPQANLLSESFANQAILAVQDIARMQMKPGQPTPNAPSVLNLSSYAVTATEFIAQFQIAENFLTVSSAEKGVPLRRTRCAAALVQMFKSLHYKWPQACAYVEKEAPE